MVTVPFLKFTVQSILGLVRKFVNMSSHDTAHTSFPGNI